MAACICAAAAARPGAQDELQGNRGPTFVRTLRGADGQAAAAVTAQKEVAPTEMVEVGELEEVELCFKEGDKVHTKLGETKRVHRVACDSQER